MLYTLDASFSGRSCQINKTGLVSKAGRPTLAQISSSGGRGRRRDHFLTLKGTVPLCRTLTPLTNKEGVCLNQHTADGMTTFLNPGPAREKLVGSGVFFEGSIGVVGHESGGGVGSQDEMDTDHFNELDHIFDLSYSAEQDPFGSGSGHAQSQGTGYGHPPQTQLGGASLLMPHPHNSHGAISHDGSRMHNDGMDWRAKDEDCSYHTAVDASCHIDSSYHHVDASGHSMVDASGHSTIDASGHDSLIDSSGHYDDYLAHKGDARYMEHSCEACKRSKVRHVAASLWRAQPRRYFHALPHQSHFVLLNPTFCVLRYIVACPTAPHSSLYFHIPS